MDIDEIIKVVALGAVGYAVGTLIAPLVEHVANRMPMFSSVNFGSIEPMIPLVTAALFTLPVSKGIFSSGGSKQNNEQNNELEEIKKRLDVIEEKLNNMAM